MIQQLNINNVNLPNVKGGNYSASEELLTKQIEMASGRMVEEIRGKVWTIQYNYPGNFTNDVYLPLMETLRGRGGFQVTFLPDNGDDLITSTFLCTKREAPKYIMEHQGNPIWAGISFTLREVTPHD